MVTCQAVKCQDSGMTHGVASNC